MHGWPAILGYHSTIVGQLLWASWAAVSVFYERMLRHWSVVTMGQDSAFSKRYLAFHNEHSLPRKPHINTQSISAYSTPHTWWQCFDLSDKSFAPCSCTHLYLYYFIYPRPNTFHVFLGSLVCCIQQATLPLISSTDPFNPQRGGIWVWDYSPTMWMQTEKQKWERVCLFVSLS